MDQNPSNTSQAKKPWYKTADGWKTLLECIAIPFAIAYAVVTYCQWRDLGDNFRIDERAWVGVKDIQIVTPLSVGAEVNIGVNLINTGKTPGRNLKLTQLSIGRTETEVETKADITGPGVVAPGGNDMFYVGTNMSTQLDITALEGNAPTLYVRGVFVYDDIFGETRHTGFCAFYPTTHKPNFFNCPHGGNWMD